MYCDKISVFVLWRESFAKDYSSLFSSNIWYLQKCFDIYSISEFLDFSISKLIPLIIFKFSSVCIFRNFIFQFPCIHKSFSSRINEDYPVYEVDREEPCCQICMESMAFHLRESELLKKEKESARKAERQREREGSRRWEMDETTLRIKKQDDLQYMDTICGYDCKRVSQNRTSYHGFSNLFKHLIVNSII